MQIYEVRLDEAGEGYKSVNELAKEIQCSVDSLQWAVEQELAKNPNGATFPFYGRIFYARYKRRINWRSVRGKTLLKPFPQINTKKALHNRVLSVVKQTKQKTYVCIPQILAIANECGVNPYITGLVFKHRVDSKMPQEAIETLFNLTKPPED